MFNDSRHISLKRVIFHVVSAFLEIVCMKELVIMLQMKKVKFWKQEFWMIIEINYGSM